MEVAVYKNKNIYIANCVIDDYPEESTRTFPGVGLAFHVISVELFQGSEIIDIDDFYENNYDELHENIMEALG